jgi:hypothetical protein
VITSVRKMSDILPAVNPKVLVSIEEYLRTAFDGADREYAALD